MRKLPFQVTLFDSNDEPTSLCQFSTERAAGKGYEKAIVSAVGANTSRILLQRLDLPALGFNNWITLAQWIKPVSKPDVRAAGYIVHSARTLNDGHSTLTTSNAGKVFHETYDEAERQARHLADKWSDGHEGLIIFKAIKHVQKVERKSTTTRIRVRSV